MLPHVSRAISLASALALAAGCGDAGSDETELGSITVSPMTTAAVTTAGPPATDATSSAVEGCPAPLVECGSSCVDLDHHPAHCGECFAPCEPGSACLLGVCGLACGPDRTECDGQCVDLATDQDHCGGCGQVCLIEGGCQGGVCGLECPEGWVECDGLCVWTINDESSCGACGASCPAGQLCTFSQCVETTIDHVLISGQSLSEGHSALVLSDAQPYENLSFNTGVRAGGVDLDGFMPLVETQNGPLGETIASGMANLFTEIAPIDAPPRVLVSAHGVSGQAYAAIKKGTAAYANGLAQVTAGAEIAALFGEQYAVRAVAIIHGESDHLAGNMSYVANLLEWQADYETDVQAITQQALPVPMLLCQMSSFTQYGQASSTIPLQQLAAARARPDRIFIVGPKYFLPYSDGVHLTGDGERWLGEHYAKVYSAIFYDGLPWRPLEPLAVTRAGAEITIEFHVPSPPLALDTELVSDPGAYGFEYFDESDAPPTITAVELISDTAVRLTLSEPPVGLGKRVRYAYTGAPNQPAGPMTGARGNLRDSDATPSRHGYPLYNWAVHFDESAE